ncbi:tubulin-tyrosine ligase [Parasponia andersonii]|uniref:Tubulin-tyrosine ligase n=1 Tax=Parasponia andersonii TaxID=3476 RepID=A0A2P5DPJ5_PARAD|nr:tubulin-tyrosine ligase [Parasponia andersonii]
MEEYMKECMRKLALWHTRTFKPIMTHDELEPIMATLGFVGLPPTTTFSGGVWKEYVCSAGRWVANSGFSAAEPPPPRAKLPYPRVDGLHIYTYRAFIDAVNFYLEMGDFSDLFHVRGMPLHRAHDRSRKWRRMEEDDSVFVYREGTLDQATYNLYHFDKNSSNNGGSNKSKSIGLRNRGNNTTSTCIVPLKDLVPSPVKLERV